MRLLDKITAKANIRHIDEQLTRNVKAAFKEPANIDDLVIVMAEMTPIAKDAAALESTDRSLTAAFNHVADLLPVFREYLENGNLPPKTAMKLANLKKYEASGEVIINALATGQDAVMIGVAQDIEQNTRLQDALNRFPSEQKAVLPVLTKRQMEMFPR